MELRQNGCRDIMKAVFHNRLKDNLINYTLKYNAISNGSGNHCLHVGKSTIE